MTPFGIFIRSLRAAHDVKLNQLADALSVKAAYLSALERGKKGKPSPELVKHIIAFFNLNKEQASELIQVAEMSDPKHVIPEHSEPGDYELAHLFMNKLNRLDDFQRKIITEILTYDEDTNMRQKETNTLLSKSQTMIRKGEKLCA
jgi:transcriptional regulator with XRE-family HTH domain